MEFTVASHFRLHSFVCARDGRDYSRLVSLGAANWPGFLSTSQCYRICVYLLTPECPATAVIRSVRAI
jgi:hypothetical protein